MKLPSYVQTAINLLESSGYSCYVVGGAVRDYLLGKTPNDFDLSTSATPEEMKRVFKDFFTIDTGLKHGTISVMIDHKLVEITTYRYEDDYADFRRPNAVHFIKTIEEDLARRDFTINSIAYNNDFVDINDGKKDLENGVIRAIGNPKKRFMEDPLRILRGLRFASTLNFKIEEETKNEILNNFYLIDKVAKERINSEFSKLLLGDNASTIIKDYKEYIQNYVLNTIIEELSILALSILEKDIEIRLASLLSNLETEVANNVLIDLKYPKKIINKVIKIIANLDVLIIAEKKSILETLKNIDYNILGSVIKIKKAKLISQDSNLDEIIKIEEVFKSLENKYIRLKDLKINGNDLKKIGFKEGKQIKVILDLLVDDCINGLTNDYDVLIKRAKYYLDRNKN